MKKLFILAAMLLAALQFTAAQSIKSSKESGLGSAEDFKKFEALADSANGNGSQWFTIDGHRCLLIAVKGVYTDAGAAAAAELGWFYKRSTFFLEGRYAKHRSGAFAGYRYDFVPAEKRIHFSLEASAGFGEQVIGLKIDKNFSGNISGYMSDKYIIYKAKFQTEAGAEVEFLLKKNISLKAFGGIIYRPYDGSKLDIETEYNFSGAEIEEIRHTLKNNSDLVKKVGWKVGVSISFRLFKDKKK